MKEIVFFWVCIRPSPSQLGAAKKMSIARAMNCKLELNAVIFHVLEYDYREAEGASIQNWKEHACEISFTGKE